MADLSALSSIFLLLWDWPPLGAFSDPHVSPHPDAPSHHLAPPITDPALGGVYLPAGSREARLSIQSHMTPGKIPDFSVPQCAQLGDGLLTLSALWGGTVMNSHEVFTQPLASCDAILTQWHGPVSTAAWVTGNPPYFFPADPALFGVPWAWRHRKVVQGRRRRTSVEMILFSAVSPGTMLSK